MTHYLNKHFIYILFVIGIFSSLKVTGQTPDAAGFQSEEALMEFYNELNAWDEAANDSAILNAESRITPAIEGREDTLAANIYAILGNAHNSQGNFNKAITYYNQEKNIREKLNQKLTGSYSDMLYNLATVYSQQGKYKKAESIYEELIQLDAQLYGPESPEYALTADYYGLLSERMSKFNKAEKLYKKSLSQLTKKDALYPVVLNDMGSLYTKMGLYSEAKQYFINSLEIIEAQSGKSSRHYIRALMNLADLYMNTGQYPEAEEIYMQIRKDRDFRYDRYTQAAINNDLALIHKKLGRYEQAEELLLDLLKMDENIYGKGHPNYANTLNNIAALYSKMGDFEKSVSYSERAIEVMKSAVGVKNTNYSAFLNNLAFTYRQMGKFEKAEKLYKKVLKTEENLLGKNHPDYANSVYNFGNLNLARGDDEKAIDFLTRAFEIREVVLGPQHPKYAQSTEKLAVYHWNNSNHKPAQKFYRKTFENYFHQIEAYFPVLSENEKAQFYNNKVKVSFEAFNSYAVSQHENFPELLGTMYNYQLATKGLILYATDKVRSRILNSGDSALINKYNQWIAKREKLARIYSLSRKERKEQGINLEAIEEQANLLEKELSQASGLFKNTFQDKQLKWEDVRATLEPGEAAVEIIRYRKFLPDSSGRFSNKIRYAALIVKHDTRDHPQLVLLKNGNELEGRYLANYRNAIRFKIREDFSYNQYWKPIAAKLKGVNKVYFSPDGVYNQISLNTLRNPNSDEYILNEIQIHQVTNTKDLITYNNQSSDMEGQGYNSLPEMPDATHANLFGFPNFDKGMEESGENMTSLAKQVSNSTSFERGIRGGLRGNLQRHLRTNQLLSALPGTKVEVNNISELHQKHNLPVNTFLQDQAMENQIKMVKNPKTLHVATHGYFLEDNAPSDPDQENRFIENPLLRSGLILAGANNFLTSEGDNRLATGEDGILTAYEAMNLNLDDTKLVVLSACETGLGELKNGEGVYGLQRSFQVAGAENVIMSLWEVDDEATRKLMTKFYEVWLNNGNKQDAFRKAQQALKKEYPQPFYWGAFVMVGK